MFAKIFGQIFDSSIAEDYNCRRMFIDLLVLADSEGVVDMTPEAISRRTNVPLSEVERYIHDLQQPDSRSRSQLEEGKRLVKISDERDWGWQIVNYEHYRGIRDEESRRSYFREAQRKRREKLKKIPSKSVKDKVLTNVDGIGQVLTPASPSQSSLDGVREFGREKGIRETDCDWFYYKCEGNGWTNDGKKIKNWKATLISWQKAGYLPSDRSKSHAPDLYREQGAKNMQRLQPAPTGPAYERIPEGREPTAAEVAKSKQIANEHVEKLRKQLKAP